MFQLSSLCFVVPMNKLTNDNIQKEGNGLLVLQYAVQKGQNALSHHMTY